MEHLKNIFKRRQVKKRFSAGLIKSPIDSRDFVFSTTYNVSNIDVPHDYIPTDLPAVYNQGDSSQCCACAFNTIRFIQERNNDQSQTDEKFSASFTYANRVDGEDFEGMYLRSCCKKGREGSVLWSELPNHYSYEKSKELFLARKDELLNKAYPFRISSFYTCKNKEEIQKAVYTLGGVLIGIPVYNCFYSPDKNGYIKYNKLLRGKDSGGHALAIVGWKHDTSGKLYWLIANSWGDDWGNTGYCYLPEDYPFMDSAYAIVDEVTEVKIDQYRNDYK